MRRSPETPGLRYIDLSTPAMLSQIVVQEGVDWIIHNASILSAVGEKNPDLAMRVNIEALNTVFQVARQQSSEANKIRLMVPSSISAFGPTTPLDNTPNETIQHPTTIYGVSKARLWCVHAFCSHSFLPGYVFSCRDFFYVLVRGHVVLGADGRGVSSWESCEDGSSSSIRCARCCAGCCEAGCSSKDSCPCCCCFAIFPITFFCWFSFLCSDPSTVSGFQLDPVSKPSFPGLRRAHGQLFPQGQRV